MFCRLITRLLRVLVEEEKHASQPEFTLYWLLMLMPASMPSIMEMRVFKSEEMHGT